MANLVGRKVLPKEIVLPGGERYVPVVFKVTTRDERGVPEALTLLPPGSAVEVVGGEEFLVAYVPGRLVRP